MEERTSGWVYFVLAPQSRRVKIGWTAMHPKTRLSGMQVGSPEPLELLGVIAATEDLETTLHGHFASAWTGGEWFEFTPELAEYIDEEAQSVDTVKVRRGSGQRKFQVRAEAMLANSQYARCVKLLDRWYMDGIDPWEAMLEAERIIRERHPEIDEPPELKPAPPPVQPVVEAQPQPRSKRGPYKPRKVKPKPYAPKPCSFRLALNALQETARG